MPCRELRFVLSVVFYVVNENPQNCICSKSCKKQKKTPEIRRFQVFFGAADQIRTGDLILTKDALYRLSYISISCGNIDIIAHLRHNCKRENRLF